MRKSKEVEIIKALSLALAGPADAKGVVAFLPGKSDVTVADSVGSAPEYVGQVRTKHFGRLRPPGFMNDDHREKFQAGKRRYEAARTTERAEEPSPPRRATSMADEDQTPTALASLRRRVASLEQVAADRAITFSDMASRLSFLERELGVVPPPPTKIDDQS